MTVYQFKRSGKLHSRVCVECEKEFTSTFSFKKYCSGKCATAAAIRHRRVNKGKRVTCPHCLREFPAAFVWAGRGGFRR